MAHGTPPRRKPLLAAAVADFFSIEASFVLFLGSGTYKNFPAVSGFPLDLTLLTFVVTLCLIVWAFVSGRIRSYPLNLSVLLMLLFSELVAASLFWSSLDVINTDKAVRFLILTGTSFFVAHLLAQDRKRQRRLLRLLAWLSIMVVLYYGYRRYVVGDSLIEGDDQAGHLDAGAYQEYGAYASNLFITSLTLAAFGSRKQAYAAVFGLGMAVYALLIIGGRGALATALLAIPLLVLCLLRNSAGSQRAWRLAACLSALIAMAAVGYGAAGYFGTADQAVEAQFRTVYRYQAQLSTEDTLSMDERRHGQTLAWKLWLQKPIFGWGIGEYRIKDSYLKYPHNLPLEILVEVGIAGLFLLFTVLAVAVRDCVRIAKDPECQWTDAAIALTFLTDLALNLTVTGNLMGDRLFLAYVGLVIGSCAAATGRFRTAEFLSLPRSARAITRQRDGVIRGSL